MLDKPVARWFLGWGTTVALVAAAIAAGVLAGPAQAETGFRCGTRLVSVGDHLYEVREKCGDPEAITQKVERRIVKHRVRRWSAEGFGEDVTLEREVEVLVDEWVYDLGDNRFVRYVVAEDNRVVTVFAGARSRKNR